MSKKLLPAAALLIAAFALSCCAVLNEPKQAVKAHLDAWSQGDCEAAFSYLAPELQESLTFETFTEQVDRVPIRSYRISSISVSASNSTAVVKGAATLHNGDKTGLRYELLRKGEEWKIWGYDINPDLLFEEEN